MTYSITSSAVAARLPETYQWLIAPTQTSPQSDVEWQAFRGHTCLGDLPRTRKWQEVVSLIAGGAGACQVANAVIRAAERGLNLASEHAALVEAFWILTQRQTGKGGGTKRTGKSIVPPPPSSMGAFAQLVARGYLSGSFLLPLLCTLLGVGFLIPNSTANQRATSVTRRDACCAFHPSLTVAGGRGWSPEWLITIRAWFDSTTRYFEEPKRAHR